MATKHVELGYHGLNLPALTATYGSRLEALTAQDKLVLGSGLLLWQSYDTELQENDIEGGIGLGGYLREHSPIDEGSETVNALGMLAEQGLDDEAALNLVIALCQQLLEGVYSP